MVPPELDPGQTDPRSATHTVPATSLSAVAFPGYVRNVPRATAMLGGPQAIAAALKTPNGVMRMSYRPGQQGGNTALMGDVAACRGLVLRVSRKQQPDKASQELFNSDSDRAEVGMRCNLCWFCHHMPAMHIPACVQVSARVGHACTVCPPSCTCNPSASRSIITASLCMASPLS